MNAADVIASNIVSPVVLCFWLGALATFARSEVSLPDPVFNALSTYLMLAIGLKGGVELSVQPLATLVLPIAGSLALAMTIPLWTFFLLRKLANVTVPDAAAMAAHYGSVSAVTFAAVTSWLDRQGTPYEGYSAALLAIMEIPAIIAAIGIAAMAQGAPLSIVSANGALVLRASPPILSQVLGQAFSSKSVLILAGGLGIGMLVGPSGMTKIKPLFVDLFQGALCLFLLHLGGMAAARIASFREVGVRLAIFAVGLPILHAALGVLVARACGMSEGGATVVATLAASASYIAAPAAVRIALPEASPGIYLTCSLAITFPFNVAVGLPLYAWMASIAYS